MSKNPRFKRSYDTSLLVLFLEEYQGRNGSVITYDEMSAKLGRNVRTEARTVLGSAMRILLSEKNMVFDTVLGVGIKLLDDGGIVAKGTTYQAKARRVAQRGAKVLSAVDFNSLSPDQKRQHNASAGILAVIDLFTSTAAVKKISEAVGKAQAALPTPKMLELFRS